MRTIRKRLLALLLTVAMLGTLFAGLPIASAASEALGNVTDAAVDGNTLLLTIDSGGSRQICLRWKYAKTISFG